MTRTRAFAVVCLLLVLIGGSISVALGDSSRDAAETSKQIAAPSGQIESVEVQILPEEHRTLRDQSVFFVARIAGLPEDTSGFYLGLKVHSGGDTASYEFHRDAVITVNLPLFFPDSNAVAYVQKTDSSDVVDVPFTLSPNTKFSVNPQTIEATVWTKSFEEIGSAESRIGIYCHVECQTELFIAWLDQNLERIVAVLSLLVAFFGRKKIWALLRIPKTRLADTATGKQEHREERNRETE